MLLAALGSPMIFDTFDDHHEPCYDNPSDTFDDHSESCYDNPSDTFNDHNESTLYL